MRRSVQAALDWMAHEMQHRSQDWSGMCLRSARSAWGLPVLAPSARDWWARVPASHRHHTDVDQVPAGAMCYAPLGHYGHAWIAARGGQGFSTDYRRHGQIDRAPMNLPAWTHDQRVWWTNWVPGAGPLPLYRDERNHERFPHRRDE